MSRIHQMLDCDYTPGELSRLLDAGVDLESRHGERDETPLHVATRRRRCDAVARLIDAGADVNARTRGGKTAYAHALRRGFDEVAALLTERGADASLSDADRFAAAVVHGNRAEAEQVLNEYPGVVRTGNVEEDRLLADLSGRPDSEPVAWLISLGANVDAPGLDGGGPLHQAAWFGQPQNARLLIDSGAKLESFDNDHHSSPLGWAVHGSRYSGGADDRPTEYAALVEMLLEAGAETVYPGDSSGDFLARLLNDAPPHIAEILRRGAAG